MQLVAQEYVITDFGAKPDSTTMNTVFIQAAIDSAHHNGGGRIVVPAGTFLTGSLVLKSDTRLHLNQGAVLLGSPDPADYKKINRYKALILADGAVNLAITGKGTIDGQGRRVSLHLDSLFHIGQIDSAHYEFAEKRPKWDIRPQIIEFVNCRNIIVKDVTLRNAAFWVQTHDRCENIIIDNVRTESDAYWNNDGIDISDCRQVRITNCFVNSSDDGICLKSHSPVHFCDSIYIANCTIRSSASAIKFGTKSLGGFRNVTIENIKVFDTFRSAIAIESVDGGFLENVLVENVEAQNTGNALFIRLGNRVNAPGGSSLKNITIRNMIVQVPFGRPDHAYEVRGPDLPFFHNTMPSSITGIPGFPVENVTLENITIHYPGRGNDGLAHMPLWRLDQIPEQVAAYPEFSMFGELPAWGLYVRHVNGLKMKNIQLTIDHPDYRAAIVFDDVRGLEVESLRVEGDEKPDHIILHNTQDVKLEPEVKVRRK
jgi:polygalacturonase